MFFIERFIERRPAGAGMELCIGTEQRQTAQSAGVGSREFIVEQCSAKRGFGSVVEQNASLFAAEVLRQSVSDIVRYWRHIISAFRSLTALFWFHDLLQFFHYNLIDSVRQYFYSKYCKSNCRLKGVFQVRAPFVQYHPVFDMRRSSEASRGCRMRERRTLSCPVRHHGSWRTLQ